jgi:phage protein D
MNKEQAAPYEVLVDGQGIAPEQLDRITEIRVVDYLRLPDVCTVQIVYPRAEDIDSQPFAVGAVLELRLGAAEELVPATLFTGQVATVEPEFGSGGCSLTVRAFDRTQLLHRSRRVRTFQNQTTGDIVAKVVGEAGLTPDCESTPFVHEFVQQDNETDWELLLRLADRIGYELVVEDTIVHLRRPSLAGAVELEWPTTLRSFRPRVTAVQQVQEVTLYAHDPKTKQVIEASATRPEQLAEIGVARDSVTESFEPAVMHVATEPVKTQGEATTLAQALLDKLANGYVAADGIAAGNPRIKAGTKVRIAGVGSNFSGVYRVASATHVLRGGYYETRFANSTTHTILDAVGSQNGGVPRFSAHLVLGIVTNNNDPDEMGRVRVQYPALGAEHEGAWARVVTPSAGKERGLLMLPVVGEEVLVGFEHDDTTRPYVLGSLFNGRDLPGEHLIQNRDGSFAVRSDKKIYSESKEQYTIKSGAKLVVEIADNVEEKFQKDWKNDTTGKASLKATQPFEIEGQNVTITGKAQVSVEASATLTLKCGPSEIQLSSAGVRISGPMINLG